MDELEGGIRRVTLPLPTRPGHVHAYLLPGADGWIVVDTGVGLPEAKELWARRARAARVAASRRSSSPTSTRTTSARRPTSTS